MRHVLCVLPLALLLVASFAFADPDEDAKAAVAVAIACRQAPLPPQAPGCCDVKPHLPGKNCKCGCVETGRCVCKDCDHPRGADPRPPDPNCQCGCTKTGKCDCKDCDHPRVETKSGAVTARPWPCQCSGLCRCDHCDGVYTACPCEAATRRLNATPPSELYPLYCPRDGAEMRTVVSWDGRWLECSRCHYTMRLSATVGQPYPDVWPEPQPNPWNPRPGFGASFRTAPYFAPAPLQGGGCQGGSCGTTFRRR
jgi:hypothetical protein